MEESKHRGRSKISFKRELLVTAGDYSCFVRFLLKCKGHVET